MWAFSALRNNTWTYIAWRVATTDEGEGIFHEEGKLADTDVGGDHAVLSVRLFNTASKATRYAECLMTGSRNGELGMMWKG
jgi:hypothetical protein